MRKLPFWQCYFEWTIRIVEKSLWNKNQALNMCVDFFNAFHLNAAIENLNQHSMSFETFFSSLNRRCFTWDVGRITCYLNVKCHWNHSLAVDSISILYCQRMIFISALFDRKTHFDENRARKWVKNKTNHIYRRQWYIHNINHSRQFKSNKK